MRSVIGAAVPAVGAAAAGHEASYLVRARTADECDGQRVRADGRAGGDGAVESTWRSFLGPIGSSGAYGRLSTPASGLAPEGFQLPSTLSPQPAP